MSLNTESKVFERLVFKHVFHDFRDNDTLTSLQSGFILGPCLSQLSMEFFLLRNVEMPPIVGILKFMSGKNITVRPKEPNAECLDIFILMSS